MMMFPIGAGWAPRFRISSLLGALIALIALVALSGLGCGAREELYLDDGGPLGGNSGVGGQGQGGQGGNPPKPFASAVDLLIVVDNSGSMADKQELLGLAVPDLMKGLVNPPCLDAAGVPVPFQPTSPDQPCPAGSARRFAPVQDLHVGLLTSSLGGHGADTCSMGVFNNDKGQLIARDANLNPVATYSSLGFLAWDPLQQLVPAGETDLGILVTSLQTMVLGAGQQGCGFEAPLEAWYRFLVDPDPYDFIAVEDGAAVLNGTDNAVLKQRRDFLRPNSLLMVVTLSDENDCSIRDGGQFFFVAQQYVPQGVQPYHLPKPRAACATDPNDPCCRSCGQGPAAGCSTAQDDCTGSLSLLQDHINLRCFAQKQRFGIDFLYPIERYVSGLNAAQVQDRFGNVANNPIFSDLNPNDGINEVRTPELVVYASLIGVPWQDLARRNASGVPDLLTGLDAQGVANGGFQSADELANNGVWPLILGDPENYATDPSALPSDALMIESVEPRSGVHPVLGVPVAPPGAGYLANPVNGHEYSIPLRDSLQFACMFALMEPRNCDDPNQIACDCQPGNDSPLCQSPNSSFTTTQRFASAYPGIRHLRLSRSLGQQAVVGSICPAQLDNPSTLDFGYRPLVSSLLERSASFLEQ